MNGSRLKPASKRPRADRGARASAQSDRHADARTIVPKPENFSVAEFADWIQDGIEIWQQASNLAELDAAFAPIHVSGRTSLVMAVVRLSQQVPYHARTRFRNGLVFGIANWTGIRPITVLQTLIQVCTELRPPALIDHLHRFVASSVLDGESEADRELTIDLAVTLAVGYPFESRIELFFQELKATGLWRPRMAARKVLAQTLANPLGWLDFTKECMHDWAFLSQSGQFDVTHILGQIVSTAGIVSTASALESLLGDDQDQWILDKLQANGTPVLERVRRGDGDYLVASFGEVRFLELRRGEMSREDRVAAHKRRQFLDRYLRYKTSVPTSQGGKLLFGAFRLPPS